MWENTIFMLRASLGIKGFKGRDKSYRFRCDRDAKGLGVLGESVCIR